MRQRYMSDHPKRVAADEAEHSERRQAERADSGGSARERARARAVEVGAQ